MFSLSLLDALPISARVGGGRVAVVAGVIKNRNPGLSVVSHYVVYLIAADVSTNAFERYPRGTRGSRGTGRSGSSGCSGWASRSGGASGSRITGGSRGSSGTRATGDTGGSSRRSEERRVGKEGDCWVAREQYKRTNG